MTLNSWHQPLIALALIGLTGCASVSPSSENIDCTVPAEVVPTDRREVRTTTPLESFLDNDTLEQCTRQGVLSAQTVLAVRLLSGEGAEKDVARGDKLLRDAADQKHPDALFNLGAAYSAGIFGEPDDAKAANWFARAAEVNDPNGVHWLGFFYWVGRGVEQDQDRALELFARGASLKHAESAFMLGQAFHTGEGREKDLEMALEWYEKANTWAFHQFAQWNTIRVREEMQEAQSETGTSAVN